MRGKQDPAPNHTQQHPQETSPESETDKLAKGLTCHVRKQIEPFHGIGISPDQLTGIIIIIVD